MHTRFTITVFLAFLMAMIHTGQAPGALPPLDRSFGVATATTQGDQLIVSTGRVQRVWRLTDHGLVTVGLTDLRTGQEWGHDDATVDADWTFPGLIDPAAKATLVSLTASPSDDDGFTGEHLEIVADFKYPTSGAAVRYVIWAYPDAPGLRTQLLVKHLDAKADGGEVATDWPTIEPLKGRSFIAPGSAKVAGAAQASNLHHDKSIELHAKGLDTKQEYILGLTWWDWGSGGRQQKVRVTSVDGETAHTIIPQTLLPAWKGKRQMPATLTAKVPNDVMLDDTFRIFIDKIVGNNANVSEIWLYESGQPEPGVNPIDGPTDRIAAISAQAPSGYHLAAYLDAGEKSDRPSSEDSASARVDFLPLAIPLDQRRAFGLMQGIKTNMKAKILKEEDLSETQANVGWANGVVLESGDQGLILVKESNKHTALRNQDDVATGGFVFDENHIAVTGAGMFPDDVKADAYTAGWATWLVLYHGDPWQGNLTLKQFDRLRYPIDPQRDIYIMANTWGTEDQRAECLHAAREHNVLRELESVADLGIDVLQIDDGWQTPQWTPAATANQVQRGQGAAQAFGNYPVYPDGWSQVREKADRLGVTLGLWAAWTAPVDALETNYDLGDFKYFKLDFANLNTKERFDDLVQKARTLTKHSGHTARVNWDVTEIAPRMGYFYGREYGNIYLENRKTKTVRDPVLYVPHKVLNDAWNLSKYVNLNQFQVTVQNVDNVRPGAPTDAAAHSHDYAVGIALMSSPIFFQETRHYKPRARERVREILSIYKKHRLAMYDGYVFPIGAEPDNRSWTGFQNHNPETGNGYLTIFRERLNKSPNGTLRLNFVNGIDLKVTNLLTGESSLQTVGPEGEVEFTIPDAPGFLFLSYVQP